MHRYISPDHIRFKVGKYPGGKLLYTLYRAVKDNFRKLCFYITGGTRYNRSRFYSPSLLEAAGDCSHETDIFDHLNPIFFFAVGANPGLMVELGTRGGESTRALLAAASVTDSVLLSIDIEDLERGTMPFQERWHFLKADDIAFGETEFNAWCRERSIDPIIDVLFIDTSHEYLHTRQELQVWSKHMADEGIMIFHDTNMGKGMYTRNDGSMGFGWNNKRGVIRALEEFIGRKYDENSFFCDVTDAYSLIHFPNSNGLTIMKKNRGSSKQ